MASLFKSAEAKKEILALYEEKLDSLNIAYQYLEVQTSFGHTNIITAGSPSNPPILLIHGSNGCAPVALETYSSLHQDFRVFAIDLLAQPNKSAENRLSMKDNSYGKWMHEIILELGLSEVTLAGFSLGGLIILKTLIESEENIKAAFLSAPAYIVNGNPLTALFKVFLPMKLYLRKPQEKHLDRFLSSLFSEPDAFAKRYLSQVLLHFDMDFTPVPTITQKEAAQIKTPLTLIAAQNDILFPGKKMVQRAKRIFPSLKEAILLEQSKHVQNKTDNKMIEGLIRGSLR